MAKASSKAPKKPAAETLAQPYYLQKARVKDYPPIRDAEVEFKPGLNIIIGTNGAGKTRFLRSVADGLEIGGSKDRHAGSSFHLAGTPPLTITYLPPETAAELTFKYRFRIKLEIGNEAVEGFRGDIIPSLKDFPRFDVVFAKHGVPADRLPIINEPATIELARRSASIKPQAISLPQDLYHSIIERIWQIKGKSDTLGLEEASKAVNDVVVFYEQLLNRFLPTYSPVTAVRISEDVRFYEDATQSQIVTKGLCFDYKVNNYWFPFSALSDGTQRIIYLTCELISPGVIDEFGLSDNSRSRIILLEEPELGIHPHQLHLLLNLIREVSEKHQVILTTHSPQVLDLLKADELDRILICELTDPKKGTQFRRLTAEQQEHARRYMREVGFLSDYWRLEDLDGVAANSAQ